MQHDRPPKPLGMKHYGSIPHLSSSRLGPSDRSAQAGQEALLTANSKGRRIIVTEKLDGSNMGVLRLGDEIIPLNRAGYPANSSPHPFQRYFADWVQKRRERFLSLLNDGERIAGEWLLLAHGTRYAIKDSEDLFVAFDILQGNDRTLYDNLVARCREHDIKTAPLLSDGEAVSVEKVLNLLGENGWSGALEKAEGAVWRAEHQNRRSFLAKFVHLDKVDGKYLPELSGLGPVWNWDPVRI